MRLLVLALLGAVSLGGCGYFPVPGDPIRILTSPAEVSVCHRLGSVGYARTDGTGRYDFSQITVAVPGYPTGRPAVGEFGPSPYGNEIVGGGNFAVRLNVMRDAALAIGASDLLLSRKIYRDYSYVEGIAYSCRR